MTTTSHRWIAASGGVALLTFAVFVLLVSIAQAAGPSASLRGGAGAGYVAAGTPLRGGAATDYAVAGRAGSIIDAGAGYLAAATPLRGGAATGYAAAGRAGSIIDAGAAYAAAGPAESIIYAGRGGVSVRPTSVAASPATIIGGLAVSALVIALVAFVALGSRARRRGELAPVTSLAEAPSARLAAQRDDRERKAA